MILSARPAESPDDPVLADRAGGWRSVYVHIPFCEKVCPYCDFAVTDRNDHLMDRYGKVLISQITSAPSWGPLEAVNFGGGTPSRMPVSWLKEILQLLRSRFGFRPGAEVSLEANPEDWTAPKAEQLAAVGFNRVSLGAQSFDQKVLSYLGRRHTAVDIVRAVRAARQAGFGSVNLDLIMGSPPETFASWSTTLERALACSPDHLSTYSLTVEPGTALWRWVNNGAAAPDPDQQAQCWETADRLCAEAGLVRYEVSNAARPGHPCRYNLSIWGQGQYLGFGNGAHSFVGNRRWENVRDLGRYLTTIEKGEPVGRRFQHMSQAEKDTERLLLGIRRRAGVRPGWLGKALWDSQPGRRLREAGVVAMHNGRLQVVRPLLTDEVSRAILAVPPEHPLPPEETLKSGDRSLLL